MEKLTLIRASALALTVLLLSACFGNQIKPDVKKQIRTTEVQIIVRQSEIYADIERKSYANTQWGVLMKSTEDEREQYRINRADKAMKPVVKVMKGYKVKSLAQQIYDRGLKRVTWMNPSRVKVVNRDIPDEEKYEITKKSRADAVLFVELDYRLTDTFKGFEVTTKSSIYHDASKDTNDRPVAIYRTQHTYNWDLPNNADGIYDRNKLGKKWSEKKAAVLKKKIKEALDAQAKRLTEQLQKS